MKTERITVGGIYMAVIKGNEIRVRIDYLVGNHILGTNLEENRGIAMTNEKIVAGPLKTEPRLPKQI